MSLHSNTPRADDTPRTRQLKEVRKKRLQYFATSNQNDQGTSSWAEGELPTISQATTNSTNDNFQARVGHLRNQMMADRRVKQKSHITEKNKTSSPSVQGLGALTVASVGTAKQDYNQSKSNHDAVSVIKKSGQSTGYKDVPTAANRTKQRRATQNERKSEMVKTNGPENSPNVSQEHLPSSYGLDQEAMNRRDINDRRHTGTADMSLERTFIEVDQNKAIINDETNAQTVGNTNELKTTSKSTAFAHSVIDEELQEKINTSRKFNRSYESTWFSHHSNLNSHYTFDEVCDKQDTSLKAANETPFEYVTYSSNHLEPKRSQSPTQMSSQFVPANTGITQSTMEKVKDSLKSIDSVHKMMKSVRQSMDSKDGRNVTDSMDYKCLRSILGEEKLSRLLKNFDEIDWVSSDSESRGKVNIWASTDSDETLTGEPLPKTHNGQIHAESHTNGDNGNYRYQANDDNYNVQSHEYQSVNYTITNSQNLPQMQAITKLPLYDNGHDDLSDITEGFKTHRPEYEEPVDEIFVYDSSRTKSEHELDIEPVENIRNYVQVVKDNVKCAFSIDQIYAQAEEMDKDDVYATSLFSADRPCRENVNSKSNGFDVNGQKEMEVETRNDVNSSKENVRRKVANVNNGVQKIANDLKTNSSSSEANDKDGVFITQTGVDNVTRHGTKSKLSNTSATAPVKELTTSNMAKKQHVEGIKEHMKIIEHSDAGPVDRVVSEAKKSEPPVFTNPSLERYFSSIENFASLSSDTFEPVPEPIIEETPRKEVLTVKGKSVKNINNVEQNRVGKHNGMKHPDQSTDTFSHSTQSKKGKDSVGSSDLYQSVTQIIKSSDESTNLTEKLERLGIDFHFLKEEAKKRVADCGDDIPNASLPDDASHENERNKKQSVKCIQCSKVISGNVSVCSSCKMKENRGKNIMAPAKCAASPRVSNKKGNHLAGKSDNGKSTTTDTSSNGVVFSSMSTDLKLPDECRKSTLPKHLQDELQLNLRGSVDSTKNGSTKKSTEYESISIDFSSSSENKARNSLSRALKSQLSLDVRGSDESSVKSFTGAKSKKFNSNGQMITNYKKNRDLAPSNSKGTEAPCEEVQNELNDDDDSKSTPRNEADNVQNNEVVNQEIASVLSDELEDAAPSEESAAVVDADYAQFVNMLISDPRFKSTEPAKPSSAGPQQAKSRPISAGRGRPQSAGVSRVRASIEAEPPPRRWQTSSLAWGDVNKSSSGQLRKSQSRPTSASNARSQENRISNSSGVVKSSLMSSHARSVLGRSVDSGPQRGAGRSRDLTAVIAQSVNFLTGHKINSKKSDPKSQSTPYARYMALSPRITRGELSFLLCLPDELLLQVLLYLPQPDLYRCMRCCKHLHRLALDESLWTRVVVKQQTLTDLMLTEIGRRHPISLSLLSCQGPDVTAAGLRELFNGCAASLCELVLTGCSRGPLTGDNLLLHASTRCRHVARLDASWSNVDDCALVAMSDYCDRLESVCVNGCPQVYDDGVHAVVVKHADSLKVLELFGCFNVTSTAIETITTYCKNLVTLNLGQCWKITDASLSNLAASLVNVENLDVRGCKLLTDATVQNLVSKCSKLMTLSVANCLNLTDAAMTDIAANCPNIRSLDVCGCKSIGNPGVRAVATSCQDLQYLDISSTDCNYKSVSMVASYCSQKLEILKVNYCKQISINCLLRLVRNAPRLQKLFVYGTAIRAHNIAEIKEENPCILVETDNMVT